MPGEMTDIIDESLCPADYPINYEKALSQCRYVGREDVAKSGQTWIQDCFSCPRCSSQSSCR